MARCPCLPRPDDNYDYSGLDAWRAAEAKHRATVAKRRATLARKHARELAPRILFMLAAIGRLEIDIPATWHPFVPPDILTRWPGVAHAMGLLAELHHDWPRERQSAWHRVIQQSYFELVVDPRLLAAEEERELAMPDEDAAALAEFGVL